MVDASVAVDALAGRQELSSRARAHMVNWVQAPQIFPAEVTSALRGLLAGGQISERVAHGTRRRLAQVRLRLHPFAPYAERVWELRANLTVYDAWYVAVAERLDQPLVTADEAILGAPGVRCALIDARGG